LESVGIDWFAQVAIAKKAEVEEKFPE